MTDINPKTNPELFHAPEMDEIFLGMDAWILEAVETDKPVDEYGWKKIEKIDTSDLIEIESSLVSRLMKVMGGGVMVENTSKRQLIKRGWKNFNGIGEEMYNSKYPECYIHQDGLHLSHGDGAIMSFRNVWELDWMLNRVI